MGRGEQENVVLTFTDNGKGIDAANLVRIFDPFFTTRLGQGGSGLGLSISRNIASGVLGGSLTVTSTPDQGACFRLCFPRIAPDTQLPPLPTMQAKSKHLTMTSTPPTDPTIQLPIPPGADAPDAPTALPMRANRAPMASQPFMRTIKSFVKRAGRTTTGQAKAFEDLGPKFLLPYQSSAIDLKHHTQNLRGLQAK